jgi:hypothetical protein
MRWLMILLLASCSNREVEELRTKVLEQSRAHEVACDLADRVGARPAGSEGDRRAVAWALARMQELGLSNVRAEMVKVTRWERGAEHAEIVSPVRQRLFVAGLGQSVAGTVEAEVVRVGSIEELQSLPDERVKGRIVFYDKPMERGPRALESYASAVDVRSAGAAAAAKKGAVASIIRSIGTGSGRFPHTGAQRTRDGIPPIPAAALAIPDAELLARLIAAGEEVRVKLSLESTLHGEAESANVIGELTGREKPDEIVLLGAHLDSWDLGTGAVDDGTGVGAALEIVRLLKAAPPRRTIRVVLFANEEHGLAGAFGYAKTHQAELMKHQAALELDLGTGRALDFRWHAGPTAEPVMHEIGEALEPLGITPAKQDPDAGGADLIPLGPAGVPKVDLLQDSTRYFDVHHTADDTCDKIEPDALAQLTSAATVVTFMLAETPELLERAPRAK